MSLVKPDYVTERDDVHVDKTKACWRLRHDLKKCIFESDCVQVDKRPVRECFEDRSSKVSNECRSIQYTYMQCRRSILDMRTRFRGRKGKIILPESDVKLPPLKKVSDFILFLMQKLPRYILETIASLVVEV